MLNVQASSLMVFKTYNTDFDETIITFMDENDRPLEIEDKVNKEIQMTRYYIEPRTRKYVRRYDFLSFVRNLSKTYGKQLLNIATKTRIIVSKKSNS